MVDRSRLILKMNSFFYCFASIFRRRLLFTYFASVCVVVGRCSFALVICYCCCFLLLLLLLLFGRCKDDGGVFLDYFFTRPIWFGFFGQFIFFALFNSFNSLAVFTFVCCLLFVPQPHIVSNENECGGNTLYYGWLLICRSSYRNRKQTHI